MSRDDDITRAEVVALSAQVGSLTQRVYQLEQTIESLHGGAPRTDAGAAAEHVRRPAPSAGRARSHGAEAA